jgi:hypothetical protein
MSITNKTTKTNPDTKKTVNAKLDELQSEFSEKELEQIFKRIFFSIP